MIGHVLGATAGRRGQDRLCRPMELDGSTDAACETIAAAATAMMIAFLWV